MPKVAKKAVRVETLTCPTSLAQLCQHYFRGIV